MVRVAGYFKPKSTERDFKRVHDRAWELDEREELFCVQRQGRIFEETAGSPSVGKPKVSVVGEQRAPSHDSLPEVATYALQCH